MMAVLVVASCGGTDPAPIEPSAGPGQDPVGTAVGQAFTLRIGQHARIDGTDLTVLFREVPADSRCPVDVQCVWAGSARVVVAAGGADVGLNTGEDPRSARVDGYRLELTKLEPEPRSDAQIRPADYIATFVVTRVSSQ